MTMPSVAMYRISPPSDYEEFEKMVLDYCINRFNAHVFSYGRKGQTQQGIDIIIENREQRIGVQCKDYTKTPIGERDVDKIIQKAESFSPPIDILIIATAKEPDAIIQNYIMIKNTERIRTGKFEVQIIYWEEIDNFIKSNSEMLRKYYDFYKDGSINTEEILVTDIQSLRIKFLESYCQFDIRDLILVDIFKDKLDEQEVKYDCFIENIDTLLQHAIILQGTDIYQNIKKFMKELNDFVSYIKQIGVEIQTGNLEAEEEDYEILINIFRDKVKEKFILASQLSEF